MTKVDFSSIHKACTVLEKLIELDRLVRELTDEEFALVLRSLERTEMELKEERK